MTKELNAALYDKMAAEQSKYREWLIGQSPGEILNHAYEYAMREDILMNMENNILSPKQAKALLKSPSPLADVYKDWQNRETDHMDDIRSTIENRANDVLEAERKKSQREVR